MWIQQIVKDVFFGQEDVAFWFMWWIILRNNEDKSSSQAYS